MLPPARGLALALALSAAAALVATLAGCGDGCVDRGAGPALGANPALVAANLLPAVPAALTERVDAAFALPAGAAKRPLAGKAAATSADLAEQADDEPGVSVLYLGAIVETDPGEVPTDGRVAPPSPPPVPLTALVPGQPFRIRHFWRVVRPPGEGLRVFTYLRGSEELPDFTNLDDSPMRRAHPPSRWRRGEIIQDVQRVVLRPDWDSATATLLVGLIRRGGHAPEDRLAVRRGPTRASAVVARTLPVDVERGPPRPGVVRVAKASSPIAVDGVGDEAAWTAAPWSPDFPAAAGGPALKGRARAKLSWDDARLYVLVHVEDGDVGSPYKRRDDPLWKADCVELFIDADRNFRQYIELQVNPHNAQFDSYFVRTRATPGDVSFSAGMESQVVVRGTVDKPGDVDEGWDAELAIPWAALRGGDPQMDVRLPPGPGDRMRLNVVHIDTPAGAPVAVSSWSRITYRDFHALDRMLTVIFAAPAAPPSPTVPPGPAPGAPAAPGKSLQPAVPR